MKKPNHKILLFMDQCTAHPQDINFFAKSKSGFLSRKSYEQATTPRPQNYKKHKSAL